MIITFFPRFVFYFFFPFLFLYHWFFHGWTRPHLSSYFSLAIASIVASRLGYRAWGGLSDGDRQLLHLFSDPNLDTCVLPWASLVAQLIKRIRLQSGRPGFYPRLRRSHGEGKGYPLPYSGLENSMDCIVLGVTKSRTWLTFTVTPYTWRVYYIVNVDLDAAVFEINTVC